MLYEGKVFYCNEFVCEVGLIVIKFVKELGVFIVDFQDMLICLYEVVCFK